MRVRVLSSLVVIVSALVVLPSASSAQTLTYAGCSILYTTLTDVPDPADPSKTLRSELRRADGLPVEILCPDTQVYGREVDFWRAEERLELRGDVVFQQGGTRIAALSGRVDMKTRNGVFETATGTMQLTDSQVDRSMFGSLEPQATFTADRIEKVGPRKYVLTGATFTTCVQPTRRWQVSSSRMSLTVDRYAVMTNARLEVKDVPVLYLPVFYYPIQEDERATGFLMPTYGSSNLRGFTLSNAFFWAINRSQDLTLFHDWFSRTGQGVGAEYRYVGQNNSSGNLLFHLINERAITSVTDPSQVITPAKRSYQLRGNLSQQLPAGIRMMGQADFTTDATTQQLYQTDFAAYTQRSSYLRVDASGQWGRLRASGQAERRDVFNNTYTTSLRRLPQLNLTFTQAPIGNTKVYVGGAMDAVNFANTQDVDKPETRQTMFRTDGNVYVRAPLSLGEAVTLNGTVSLRRTDWSAHQDAVTLARIDAPLSRTLVEARVDMTGPKFFRIFNMGTSGWLERMKHVITPTASVTRRSAFARFDDVLPIIDGSDRIVGDVTEVSYGINNTLLARVRQPEGESIQQQLLSLDVTQRYYTDPNAATYDPGNQATLGPDGSVLPPPTNFGPVNVSMTLTPAPTVSGSFGFNYDTRFDAVTNYRASTSIQRPAFDLTGSWNKQQVIAASDSYRLPSHSLSLSTRLRKPGGGASLYYSTAADLVADRFLFHQIGAFYNAQCCGISVDYVVKDLKHLGRRNDKVFSISFSLAGIGSFANPLGVFGNRQ